MLKFLSKKLRFIFLLSLFSGLVQASYAKPLQIYSSIKPIQGIVAALTDEIETDNALIIPEQTSPHNYTLTSGMISKMNHADLLIWVGPQLEQSLKKYFSTTKVTTLELSTIPSLRTYPVRHLDTFAITQEAHDHDHNHGTIDGHIWLDPENAMRIAQFISEKLNTLAPEHEAKIAQNFQDFISAVTFMQQQINLPFDKPYLVTHDAYQYFEQGRGMIPKGVIYLVPGYKPSAKHFRNLMAIAHTHEKICLFTEPQMGKNLHDFFGKHPEFKSGELDPIGLKIKMDKSFYPALILKLADQYQTCFNKLD